ncbi:exported hypothetical protein [Bradyrhizobium sp. ORS 375]|uniref:hypothetical protein n=1 Tax=Bradyrhizobium sp. (strain ORS 375) TaxID=566679 RepID=UPI0002406981|nr:hypothetical protein [Bradyrhizobium sp. ORS 375]CCD94639.1 exported hypothetical protein [Bradyrhizobium sp. ORS 375]
MRRVNAIVAACMLLTLGQSTYAASVFDIVAGSINPRALEAIEKAQRDTAKAIEKTAEENAAKTTAPVDAKAKVVLLQSSTDGVLGQLRTVPLEKLYGLKVAPDICTLGLVNCGILESNGVRPFVDLEIDRRKATFEVEDKNRSFWVSVASLAISVLAVVISILAFRKESAPKPPPPRKKRAA